MSYKKLPLITALCSSLFSFAAQAAFWAPHVGVDYKYWNMRPDQDLSASNNNFGVNLPYKGMFPRVDNSYNIYAGTRINGYFGIDLGYDNAPVKRKSKVFNDTEAPFVGFEENGNITMIDLQLHALHLDLNFYWEVVRRLEVMFMMGVAYLHPETHINHFDVDYNSWVEFTEESRAKWIGRFGIGLQYNIMPCLGIRSYVNWDNTSRIEYQGFDEEQNAFLIKPYRPSTSVNLGIVYSWAWPRR